VDQIVEAEVKDGYAFMHGFICMNRPQCLRPAFEARGHAQPILVPTHRGFCIRVWTSSGHETMTYLIELRTSLADFWIF
jgi:hypothetical protein